MNQGQKTWLLNVLDKGFPNLKEVHHGSCTGSDEEFHNFATVLKLETHSHPGTSVNPKVTVLNRATLKADVTYPEKPFLVRNKTISDTCDLLIACPHKNSNTGGTWSTYNYAKRTGKLNILKR